jgi:8-oxo-dGTP pyrophosphatase MutT (NUDIX family)
MIQRKDSLGFMDIMRGKYKVNEPDYIRKQLRGMTDGERHKLETMEFEEIWHQLWGSDTESSQRYAHDRIVSRQKLAELRAGIELPSGERYTLSDLLRQEPAVYQTPEWGFPKGRRSKGETDITCGIREFLEETNISRDCYNLKEDLSFTETFKGTNNIDYRHIYFVALLRDSRGINLKKLTPMQSKEIAAVDWKTLSECKNIIRPHYAERKNLITDVEKFVSNYQS